MNTQQYIVEHWTPFIREETAPLVCRCQDCGEEFRPLDCESTRYCQDCLEQVVNEENERDDMASKPAQAVMVRGPYGETEKHHGHLKSLGFRWNATHKAWVGPDMEDNQIATLSRRIASLDVEVRRVRKSFMEASQ